MIVSKRSKLTVAPKWLFFSRRLSQNVSRVDLRICFITETSSDTFIHCHISYVGYRNGTVVSGRDGTDLYSRAKP